ncbi:MAG: hypothetical protein ACLRWA_02495 [Lachnospira sp.]
MKIKFSKSPVMMLAKLALAGLLCLVIVFIVHSNYKSRQGSRIELKSRYTFSVRIDSDGNVLDEAYNEGEKSEYQEFETPQLSKNGRHLADSLRDSLPRSICRGQRHCERFHVRIPKCLTVKPARCLSAFRQF